MQEAAETGQVFNYLTQPEVRFLDAVAARLIPADDLGPGGKEAGVSAYIDRQLGSVWGSHGRNYRQGPWPEGTPYQGFQSRLTPREIYRAAIREINVHCLKQYQKAFEFLAPGEQDEVLPDLCSRDLYRRAEVPKQLLLYPDCGHGLDECRSRLDTDLMRWVRQVLGPPL